MHECTRKCQKVFNKLQFHLSYKHTTHSHYTHTYCPATDCHTAAHETMPLPTCMWSAYPAKAHVLSHLSAQRSTKTIFLRAARLSCPQTTYSAHCRPAYVTPSTIHVLGPLACSMALSSKQTMPKHTKTTFPFTCSKPNQYGPL